MGDRPIRLFKIKKVTMGAVNVKFSKVYISFLFFTFWIKIGTQPIIVMTKVYSENPL